jgi:hypothetical protein
VSSAIPEQYQFYSTSAGVFAACVPYSDILDYCCEAWNKLTDRPWLIMSIGLRDWAHRF